MRSLRNKLTTGRTSLAKGVYPPSADLGQVPESKEGKLTKVLVSRGRTSFTTFRINSQRFSSAQGSKNFKGDPLKGPLESFGSPSRTRTYNLVVNSHPLCRLSYRGISVKFQISDFRFEAPRPCLPQAGTGRGFPVM